MTLKPSDLNQSLYEYFKYDPIATKNIQRDYIKFFKGCTKVLDIACGRGEFLELLSENGISGAGVELDEKISENIKSRGLDCICSDAFKYLERSKNDSFDGVFTSHFVEHLEPEKIIELFELCCKVLKPDGVLIITTPNVASLPMHLDYFYRDFTHVKFSHPKIIEFFLEYSGFKVVESGANKNFWFRNPAGTLQSFLHYNKTEQTTGEIGNPIEYINFNNEFKKIRYNKTNNPFIFLKRKISCLLTDFILGPQFNEINKTINNQIFNFNTQVDKINRLTIAINKQQEIIERQMQAMREINTWVDGLYPPSEVYVVARKK